MADNVHKNMDRLRKKMYKRGARKTPQKKRFGKVSVESIRLD